jgi:very-short-patch-repair endonuclease
MTDKHPIISPHMTSRARRLRQDSPVPERLLWGRLRNGRCMNLQFRRQQAMGPYVADFYCSSAKIVIELDGRSHDYHEEKGRERQQYLEQHGVKVIRFTNDQVLQNLDGVVEAIAGACLPEGQK